MISTYRDYHEELETILIPTLMLTLVVVLDYLNQNYT